ncbi:MAG: YCF48-related protein [bacterium]
MKKLVLFILILMSFPAFAQQGWNYQNAPLSSNMYGSIYAINTDTIFVIADDGVFLKSLDGGTTWTNYNTGFSESFFDMYFIDADTGYCAGANGKIIKTTDGGINWTALSTATTNNIYTICLHEEDLWAIGDSGTILNSTDYGATWNQNIVVNNKLNSIAFNNDSIGIIAGDDGTLLKTTNSGTTWTIENSNTSYDLFSLCVTQNYVYGLAGYTDGPNSDAEELLKINDLQNWSIIYNNGSNLFLELTKIFFVNDSVGFNISSGTPLNGEFYITIEKTENYGSDWSLSFEHWGQLSVGIAYADIIFVNDTVGYALSGNKILKTTDGGVWVSVKDITDNNLIEMYPNPLSNGILNFKIKGNTKVNIVIYNFNGKPIFNHVFTESQKTINLSHLNYGVYLVKLYNDNIVIETKKLTILK